MSEHAIAFDEGTVRVFRAGNAAGPPVVLLHGGGADASLISWSRTIPALANDYRVYAPDWPKHGGSFPWRGAVTQAVLEEVIGRLLDAWGLERATLVGLSMGGSAALGFVLRHPQRVASLVLVDTGGLQARAPSHRLGYVLSRLPLLGRLAALSFRSRALVRYSLKSRLFKSPVPDLDEIAGAVHAEALNRKAVYSDWQLDELRWGGLKTDYSPRLREVRCPTLLVHGSEDDLVPLGIAREAADRIPRARLEVIEGCGHWPNRERPEVFNAVLLSFLWVATRPVEG